MLKILLLLTALSSMLACQDSNQVTNSGADRYPWQVNLMSDGNSRIFGIHLNVTTVSDARQQLGISPKLALFENPDGSLSLELFYGEFTRAGLTGKLILTAGEQQIELKQLKEQSSKKEKLESGVTQYFMDRSLLASIDKLKIIAITYMPYANLEEEVILARFGTPGEKIRSHPKAQHWLYPDKGLDLIINEEGKEVLQYVSPDKFGQLVQPLRR